MHATRSLIATTIGGLLLVAGVAVAQTQPQTAVTISPAQGQTPQQQASDQSACETDAAARSGWHPSQASTTTSPTKPNVGGRGAGAARGAARGAVREQTTSKSEREVENPAEAGARAGAAAGGARQRQARRQQSAQNQQQQAAQQQKQQAYMQQFKGCLQARGYSVQ